MCVCGGGGGGGFHLMLTSPFSLDTGELERLSTLDSSCHSDGCDSDNYVPN